MNMKLYGICFKLRGGPNLLDHVQANEPVPVEMMGQVMEQVGSLTGDEMAFAKCLLDDWKKAFADRVPLTMTVAADKGYDITCAIPDELVETVSLLTGLEPGELIKEYTADHMKNVLGIDADILSVDVEHEDAPAIQAPVQTAPVQAAAGFSLDDLDESPEEPAFEDVSAFADMDMGMDIPVEGFPTADEQDMAPVVPEMQEPVKAETDVEEDEEPVYEGPEEEIPDEEPLDEEPEYYDEPDIPEEEPAAEDAKAEDEGKGAGKDEDAIMADTISSIYKDMVKNIRDRELDTRLNLRIGQQGQPQ